MLPRFINVNIRSSSAVLSILVKLADLIVYCMAALLAFYQQFGNLYLPHLYQGALLLAALLALPIFSRFGIYESLRGKTMWEYFKRLYPALFVLALILATIAFVTKTGIYFSRAWFLWWQLYAMLFLSLFRIALRCMLMIMRQRGLNQKRIIVIGSGDAVRMLVHRVHDSLWTGFSVAAILDNDNNDVSTKAIEGIKIQQLPEDINLYLKESSDAGNPIDEVWLILSLWSRDKIEKLLHQLQLNVVTVRYFPSLVGFETLNHSVTEVLGLPVINLVASPITGINRIIKAIEDRVLAALILICISPLLALVAILIKLSSSGPVFYRQMRHGCDGKPIKIYKFRTMHAHRELPGVVTQASTDDQRVTRLGRFLRRTSLDELPQFINVLQGKMSIVGPRPHAVEHNEYYKTLVTSYMLRHHVKPGITGWAQVNGWRGEIKTLDKMQKRIEYDLYYINHWSFWFDLKIIFLTLFRGFVHQNAY